MNRADGASLLTALDLLALEAFEQSCHIATELGKEILEFGGREGAPVTALET